jgi:catechol 2,3-dioxygenase-like lactoylglutathione lyase family enzyme
MKSRSVTNDRGSVPIDGNFIEVKHKTGICPGERTVGVIKIQDIAYVRYAAPDLARMRAFLADFGLTEVPGSDDTVLYVRGIGNAPFVHVTELGAPAFLSVGLQAESIEDLHRLADSETNCRVEQATRPGGGFVVALTDPDGLRVEVVAGQSSSPQHSALSRAPWNSSLSRERARVLKRVTPGPATVVRLGHCVLLVTDFRASEKWWKDRFGLLTSDEIAASPDVAIAGFLRCDRGSTPTDHHTITLGQAPDGKAVLHHAAFEVLDFDDLMIGHEFLKSKNHQSIWGIGRHLLGSQVFDYWRDPWGNRIEHWTDGDLLVAEDGANIVPAEQMFSNQWGPEPSPEFA